MTIHTYGHTRTYEMEALLKLFVPAQKFAFSTAEALPEGDYISAVITENEDGTMHLVCRTCMNGKTMLSEADRPAAEGNLLDKELSILLYPQLCAVTGLRPAWGMLTGIRPVNLLRRHSERLGCIAEAKAHFRDVWQVTEEKIALAEQILTVQQPVFSETPHRAVGIYVSIPFCPTRCRYCSFVSNSVAQMRRLLPQYMDALEQEIQIVGSLLKDTGLTVDTVYIGGGTPTVLEPADLTRLLSALQQHIITPSPIPLREYTVEAGRPDTITREKLAVLRQFDVTRISVNPQSFRDEVLQAAGRPHSAQDAVEAYLLAKEMITETTELEALGEYYCMPSVEIDMLEIDKELFDLFTYDFMKKHKVIPVSYDKNGVLLVATGKPLSCHTRSALAVQFSARIEYVLVPSVQIDRYVDSISAVVSTTSALEDLNSEKSEKLVAAHRGEGGAGVQEDEVINNPAVRLVDSVI